MHISYIYIHLKNIYLYDVRVYISYNTTNPQEIDSQLPFL